MMLGWRRSLSGGAVLLLAFGALVAAMILQTPGGFVHDRREQAHTAEVAAQQRAQAAEQRKQAEQRAANQFQDLQKAMAANQWREAAKLNGQIKAVNANLPGRAEAEKTIATHIRTLDIQEGIAEGQRVAVDAKQCDTPTAIAGAWNKIKLVRSSDPEWAAASNAATKLENCRKKVERELSTALQGVMIAQREAWASKADTTFLDQGMNVTISLNGETKERVTLKWALMSRAAAHKLTDGGKTGKGTFLGGLETIGFRKVTFSDGFDEAWSYDLTPQSEGMGGVTMLREHGIGSPLTLTP